MYAANSDGLCYVDDPAKMFNYAHETLNFIEDVTLSCSVSFATKNDFDQYCNNSN